MACRTILTHPHPVLREKAAEITEFDAALRQLAKDMAETMYDAQGVGLAGNQIGVALQIAVIDISSHEDERRYLTLINPLIFEGEGCESGKEGCLSVREYDATVERFKKIRVTAKDEDGHPIDFVAEDRFARIIQHEVDHLHGTLFIDRISRLKQDMYKRKLKKLLDKKHEGGAVCPS
ncbi:peptide deformylase [Desulfobulbus sp. F4]|nr:peptide deformylase [Desulfobulbus sp. F4]